MAEITVVLMQRSVRVTESLEFDFGEASILTRLSFLNVLFVINQVMNVHNRPNT